MIVVFVAFIINIVNDAPWSVNDNSRVMLQIVASLLIVTWDCNILMT